MLCQGKNHVEFHISGIRIRISPVPVIDKSVAEFRAGRAAVSSLTAVKLVLELPLIIARCCTCRRKPVLQHIEAERVIGLACVRVCVTALEIILLRIEIADIVWSCATVRISEKIAAVRSAADLPVYWGDIPDIERVDFNAEFDLGIYSTQRDPVVRIIF